MEYIEQSGICRFSFLDYHVDIALDEYYDTKYDLQAYGEYIDKDELDEICNDFGGYQSTLENGDVIEFISNKYGTYPGYVKFQIITLMDGKNKTLKLKRSLN